MHNITREMVALSVVFALALAAIIWRYRHSQLYAANIVAPGKRFNRIQHIGLIFIAIGLATTVGFRLINSFHSINSNYLTSSLSESKAFILIGAVTFLFGWNRRRGPNNPTI